MELNFKRLSLFFLLLISLIVLAYTPVLKGQFLNWDDDLHIYENPSIRELSLENIKAIFRNRINKIYIPLTELSYAVEYQFAGLEPFIYHLNNLILHLLNTILVFFVSRALGLSFLAGVLTTLVFGLHPVHVESVAWVTERKDVLYAFFYLLALLSYIRYVNIILTKNKNSFFYLLMTTGLGLFSILAKPMAISLPLVLLLIDWFKGRTLGVKIFIEKIPVMAGVFGIAWVTYIGHARLPGNNLPESLLIWVWTFSFYIRQLILPLVSVPIFKLPYPIAIGNPQYLSAILIIVFIICGLFIFRRRKWIVFSFLYFFISMFFLFRFDDNFDTNIVADRFLYLPCLGFCWLYALVLEKYFSASGKYTKTVAGMVIIMTLGFYGVRTYGQSKVWQNNVALWEHQLKIYPKSHTGLNGLANALRETPDYIAAEEDYSKVIQLKNEGLQIDLDETQMEPINKIDYLIELYKKSMEIKPDFYRAYYNLGQLYFDVGMYKESFDAFLNTIKINPDYTDAHFSLGKLYQTLGDPQRAVMAYSRSIEVAGKDKYKDHLMSVIENYNEAIRQYPQQQEYQTARTEVFNKFAQTINESKKNATSYFNLASIFQQNGEYDRAMSAYQMALEIDPNHPGSLYNLGNIYKDSKRYAEALNLYKKVIKIDSGFSDAYLNMGVIYLRQGDKKLAEEYFQKAVQADHNNSRAYFNLASLADFAAHSQDAIKYYQKVNQLDPQNAAAYYNLGNVYVKTGKPRLAIEAYSQAVKVDQNYLDAWINLSIMSYEIKDYENALKYLDEAVILGYQPPAKYLKALQPYIKK